MLIESVMAGLARVAIAFLNNYLARKDLQDSVRKELEIEVLKLARAAAEWKADAATQPGGGADLRVRPNGGTLLLPGEDPHSHP